MTTSIRSRSGSFRLFRFERLRLSRKLWVTYRVRLHRLVPGLLASMLAATGLPALAALPTGGTVASGQAQITSPDANTLNVLQTGNKLVVNWQSFNIGAGQTVSFVQPSSSSMALNRVTGSDPSAIYGSLKANGQVFLVNPNGVYFSSTARVDVGSVLASTLNISDADFLAGNYKFSGSGSATVKNDGQIKAAQGGYVLLAGAQASNTGSITADGGSVGLAAGTKLTLDLQGDGLVRFTVDAGGAGAKVENSGTLQADGGRVDLSGFSTDAALSTVVNQTGLVRANSVQEHNGIITLSAAGGDLHAAGQIKADSTGGSGSTSVTLQASNNVYVDTSIQLAGATSSLNVAANSSGLPSSPSGSGTVALIGGLEAGNISIGNAGSAQSLSLGRPITATGALSAVSGADLYASGGISGSDVSFKAANFLTVDGDVSASNSLSFKAANGSIFQTSGVLRSGAGGASFDAGAGILSLMSFGNQLQGPVSLAGDTVNLRNDLATQLGAISAASLRVTTPGEAISQASGSSNAIKVAGVAIFNTGAAAARVDNPANQWGGAVTFNTTGAAAVGAAGDVSVNGGMSGLSLNVAGNATATPSNALQLDGKVGGNLTVNSTAGLSQSAALTVTGTTTLSTGAANIALARTDNDFGGKVTLSTTGAASLGDANDLSVGGSASSLSTQSANGSTDIAMAGAIASVTGVSGKDLKFTGQANQLNLTAANTLTVSGQADTLIAKGSVVRLNGDLPYDQTTATTLELVRNSDFVLDTPIVATNLTITAPNVDLSGNAISASGQLSIFATTGEIFQSSSAASQISAGSTSLSAPGGLIWMGSEHNSFGSRLDLTSGYFSRIKIGAPTILGTINLTGSVADDSLFLSLGYHTGELFLVGNSLAGSKLTQAGNSTINVSYGTDLWDLSSVDLTGGGNNFGVGGLNVRGNSEFQGRINSQGGLPVSFDLDSSPGTRTGHASLKLTAPSVTIIDGFIDGSLDVTSTVGDLVVEKSVSKNAQFNSAANFAVRVDAINDPNGANTGYLNTDALSVAAQKNISFERTSFLQSDTGNVSLKSVSGNVSLASDAKISTYGDVTMEAANGSILMNGLLDVGYSINSLFSAKAKGDVFLAGSNPGENNTVERNSFWGRVEASGANVSIDGSGLRTLWLGNVAATGNLSLTGDLILQSGTNSLRTFLNDTNFRTINDELAGSVKLYTAGSATPFFKDSAGQELTSTIAVGGKTSIVYGYGVFLENQGNSFSGTVTPAFRQFKSEYDQYYGKRFDDVAPRFLYISAKDKLSIDLGMAALYTRLSLFGANTSLSITHDSAYGVSTGTTCSNGYLYCAYSDSDLTNLFSWQAVVGARPTLMILNDGKLNVSAPNPKMPISSQLHFYSLAPSNEISTFSGTKGYFGFTTQPVSGWTSNALGLFEYAASANPVCTLATLSCVSAQNLIDIGQKVNDLVALEGRQKLREAAGIGNLERRLRNGTIGLAELTVDLRNGGLEVKRAPCSKEQAEGADSAAGCH